MSSSARAFNPKKLPGGKGGLKPYSANVFIAGVGAVGGALINQFNSLDRQKYDINVIGLCNSTKMRWRGPEVSVDELYGGKSKNWSEIVEKLIESRSEEHTSELQSRGHLVCRLLLEARRPR